MNHHDIRLMAAAAPLMLFIAFSAHSAPKTKAADAPKATASASTAQAASTKASKAIVKQAAKTAATAASVKKAAKTAAKTDAAGAARDSASVKAAADSGSKEEPAAAVAAGTAGAAATAKVVISSAPAEGASADEEKKSGCAGKKALFCPFKQGRYASCPKKGKGGFFSFHIAGEWTPYDYLTQDKGEIVLGYGRHIFQKSSALEVHFRLTSDWNAGFGVKGEQDLMSNVSWTPGVDASISVGSMQSEAGADTYSLAPRFGAGVYVKTYVSKFLAINLRGGVSYEFAVDGELASVDNLNVDLSVGIKKYLRF